MAIKKASITAAGLGTRFHPISKIVPKEMLPVWNFPALHYIVEECISNEIKEIYIILNRKKESIIEYFFKNSRVEFIYQDEQKGLGHAILQAKSMINDGELFAVLLGDNISFFDPLGTLIFNYMLQGKYPSLLLKRVPFEDVDKYGIVNEFKQMGRNVFQIKKLVEKPKRDLVTTNLAVMGRYILPYSIFDHLENISPGKNGEIQLTDAISQLIQHEDVYGIEFKSSIYDIGTPLGLLKANLEFAEKFENQNLKTIINNIIKWE